MSGGQTLAQMHPAWKTVYDFLWLLGEAIFMFLPVAICWSTVKDGRHAGARHRAGRHPVSPQLMNSLPARPANAGSVELRLVRYPESRLSGAGDPVDHGGHGAGLDRNPAEKIVPDYLYLVVVPVVSLLLAVFTAHALIGPFGRMIGDGVARAVKAVMTGSFAPVGAALFGFLYAPLVITGVHQTTLAIDMQMIQSMGGTPVWR